MTSSSFLRCSVTSPHFSAALFGLAILFLTAGSGYLQDNELAWLAAAPALIFLLYIALNFPTKDKVVDYIEEQNLRKLRA